MTWWSDDSSEGGVRTTGTRARRRIKDLHRDVWEVRPYGNPDEDGGWYVLQPMDEDFQQWRRIDKEWCELVETGIRLGKNKNG